MSQSNLELNNHNLIEKLICEQIKSLPTFPMNPEQSEIMLKLILIKKSDKDEFVEDTLKFLKDQFYYKVMQKRIEHCFDYKLDDVYLMLFLMDLVESTGTLIQYLTYFQYWCFKHNTWEITFEIFVEMFPLGYPSSADLSNIWYNTKIKSIEKNWNFKFEGINIEDLKGSDNLIDYPFALDSIRKVIVVK